MYKIGEYALYLGAWGAAPAALCVITGNDGEKNGRRVYDCRIVATGAMHWGYAHQFQSVRAALRVVR